MIQTKPNYWNKGRDMRLAGEPRPLGSSWQALSMQRGWDAAVAREAEEAKKAAEQKTREDREVLEREFQYLPHATREHVRLLLDDAQTETDLMRKTRLTKKVTMLIERHMP